MPDSFSFNIRSNATFTLGGSGAASCHNGHTVHWWSASGEPPLLCDKCGERLRSVPSELTLSMVSQEAT